LARSASRSSDRRRKRQGDRIRRSRARAAPEGDRGAARLPSGRSSHGTLRRLPRPQGVSDVLVMRG
nr:hypothetical protein [Tanacetum cinerariifolium]